MPVDVHVQRLLDVIAALKFPEFWEQPVEDTRRVTAQRRMALPPGPQVRESDHQVPVEGASILGRLYVPPQATGTSTNADAPLPVLVWFHGGGFAIGSVAESGADCRHLAVGAGCAVFSVEYRLAPEHQYPTALQDAVAAIRWLRAHAEELGLDASRVAVGGDSAGGALATCASLWLRDHGARVPCFQALIYPITDLSSLDTPSYLENAEGKYLTRASMQWFRSQYVPDASKHAEAYVSPLRAESLRGLPAALVITAEYDPLRDEAEAYAARLREAGVPVKLERYAGMIHGFFSMHDHLEAGVRAKAQVAGVLREVFAQLAAAMDDSRSEAEAAK